MGLQSAVLPSGRWHLPRCLPSYGDLVISPHSTKFCLPHSQPQGHWSLTAFWSFCPSCSARATYLPHTFQAAGAALGPLLAESISSLPPWQGEVQGTLLWGPGHPCSQTPQMNLDCRSIPHPPPPPGHRLWRANFLGTHPPKTSTLLIPLLSSSPTLGNMIY